MHFSDGSCISLSEAETALCRHIIRIVGCFQHMQTASFPRSDSWVVVMDKVSQLTAECTVKASAHPMLVTD